MRHSLRYIMPGISFFTLVSVAAVSLYVYGLHYLLTSPGDRPCEMTYMYEYPQYVKISLPDDVTRVYYRYSLYAYGEGQHTNAIRKMKFSGIPVLFIPGSGGSYKQVRSLASVSLRKALNSRLPYHMDFFSVDLNEEYSAIYGGFLEVQTSFVRHAILRILSLYGENKGIQPTSVVLIGHSMGGVIAKGVFNDLSFNEDSVQVIVTLAAPHSRPVVVFDEYSSYYYQNTSQTWHIRRESGLSNITVASIGGGDKDLLVNSDLIASQEIDMHIVTTTIPTVWRSVDHQCITWCKELILVVVRALFDMVDPRAGQITSDKNLRRSVLTYHLLKRNAGKHYSSSLFSRFVTFHKGAEWVEPLMRQFTITANTEKNKEDRLSKPKNVMIRLIDHPQHSVLAVEAINNEISDWVFVCKANVIENDRQICLSGENLSNATMLWPSFRHKRKRIVLDLIKLNQLHFSHVILRMPLTSERIQFNVDVHSCRILKSPSIGLWILFDPRPAILLEKTSNKALRYEVDFSDIESLWHVLHLVVKPLSCSKTEHHAVAMFVVPWSNERSFSFINEKWSDPLRIRLFNMKPRVALDAPRLAAKAEIFLDPSCTYSISVESAPALLFSQFVRFYSSFILAFVVAILLLTLREQLHDLKRTGHCSLFHVALCRGAKPYFILSVCNLLAKILSLQGSNSILTNILNSFQLPEPSINIMARHPWELLFILLFLYAIAFGLVYMMGLASMFAVVFSAKIMNKTALSFLGSYVKNSITMWLLNSSFSDLFFGIMLRIPPLLVGLLLVLGNQTCASLGLAVGCLFFFLLMCKMYEDYLESLLMYARRVVLNFALPNRSGQEPKKNDEMEEPRSRKKKALDSAEEDEEKEKRNVILSQINVYLTVFLLYLCAFLPSIPSLLVWAHNYKYDSKLDPDPSLPSFLLIMVACSSCFWLQSFPDPKLPFYGEIANSLFVLAVLTILYAPTRLNFVPSVIALMLIIISVHQWISSVFLLVGNPPEVEQDKSSNTLEVADVETENEVDSSFSESNENDYDDETAEGENVAEENDSCPTSETEASEESHLSHTTNGLFQTSSDQRFDTEMKK